MKEASMSRQIQLTVPISEVTTKGLALGQVKFLVSNAGYDRQGQSITMQGIKTDNVKRNLPVLWAHDYESVPIGKVIDVSNDGVNLYETVQFDMSDMFAVYIYNKLKDGYVNACSIGGLVIEYGASDAGVPDYSKVLEMEQIELSIVPIGAHPDALQVANAFMFETPEEKSLYKNFMSSATLKQLSLFDIGSLKEAVETQKSYTAAFENTIAEIEKAIDLDSSPEKKPVIVEQKISVALAQAKAQRTQSEHIIVTLKGLKNG